MESGFLELKHYDVESLAGLLDIMRRPYQDAYYAMYSSLYEGVVTDPALMLIPLDDHMVHRGDGIFDTFKCVNGKIYNMWNHLERMYRTAATLEYKLSCTIGELGRIVVSTVRMAGHRDCGIRILVSRGPGSFGANPADCAQGHFFVIVSRLGEPFMTKHANGARAVSSRFVAKTQPLCRLKSCNYLENALMKSEASTAGVDFVAAFDERGFLLEGATENFGVVTEDGRLMFPELDGILPGTTMLRVVELASELERSGMLTGIGHGDISREDIMRAREMIITGTTPNIISVVEFDGDMVGDGKVGAVYNRLSELLLDDIACNDELHTLVFS